MHAGSAMLLLSLRSSLTCYEVELLDLNFNETPVVSGVIPDNTEDALERSREQIRWVRRV